MSKGRRMNRSSGSPSQCARSSLTNSSLTAQGSVKKLTAHNKFTVSRDRSRFRGRTLRSRASIPGDIQCSPHTHNSSYAITKSRTICSHCMCNVCQRSQGNVSYTSGWKTPYQVQYNIYTWLISAPQLRMIAGIEFCDIQLGVSCFDITEAITVQYMIYCCGFV